MKNSKRLVFSLAILAAVALVGGVIAVSHDRSIISNFLGVGTYKTVSTESFVSPTNWKTCEAVPKTITVKNESEGAVVARIKYTEDWIAADRTTSLELVDSATNLRMAIVNRDNTEKWLLNDDGWYYYYQPLEPGETAASFMKSVTLNCDANLSSAQSVCTMANGRTVCTRDASPYADAVYSLHATIATMQANVAESEWGYAPVENSAMFLNGTAVTRMLDGMTYVARASALPDNFPTDSRATLSMVNGGLRASTEASQKPIYVWKASQYVDWGGDAETNPYSEDTVYWYSEATKIYMNPDSSNYLNCAIADLSHLRGVNDDDTVFDASRVTNLDNAVSGCASYDRLDWLSNWDVSNVESMRGLLSGTGVHDLSALASWNPVNLKDISNAFQNMPNLTDISALGNWPYDVNVIHDGVFDGSNNIDWSTAPTVPTEP